MTALRPDDIEVVSLVATLREIVAGFKLPAWMKVDIEAWWGHYPRVANDAETWICVILAIPAVGTRATYEPLIAVESAHAHPVNAVRTPIRSLLIRQFGEGPGRIIADALLPENTHG